MNAARLHGEPFSSLERIRLPKTMSIYRQSEAKWNGAYTTKMC